MGLLTTGGPPMRYGTPENNRAIPYVLEHGVSQFLNLWRKYKDLQDYPFLWGEEVEHLVMTLSAAGDDVKLSLTADELLAEARESPTDSKWLPEYGSFMVETTPAVPYSGSKDSLASCEGVIQRRYDLLRLLLSKPGDRRVVVTLVAFPLMGRENFVDSKTPLKTQGEFSASIFVPEECTNQTHPRFGNLTRNIRLRRGRKVCIQIPMYIDEFTLQRSVDEKFRIDRHPANVDISCGPVNVNDPKQMRGFSDDDEEEEGTNSNNKKPSNGHHHHNSAAEDVHALTHLYTPATNYYYSQYHPEVDRPAMVEKRYEACPCPVPSVTHPCVYMDSMAFGMGMACLQVTMQLPDVNAARHIFDQLAVICPMFLAVTAATPIQKGMLVDSDIRWLTIAASVDDRKREEVPRIIKSRYDSVSLFISPRPDNLDAFNDNHVEIDAKVMARLKTEGLDERLARHVSHLFIRDPLVIYDGRVDTLDDQTETDHFENVQSTNWQTVRFKPPPFNTDIGWRVEFRVMEVQMTPFENAAFSVFVVLLTRAIIKYDLWLYIPMSKVDENMGRAHERDSVKKKYWFTKSTTRGGAGQGEAAEFTMDELFSGCDAFAGFIPLVERFIREEGLSDPRFEQYIDLIRRRSNGSLQTTAAFLREFVVQHPAYQRDSVVPPVVAHDIVRLADDLAAGKLAFDSFLPATLLAAPSNSAVNVAGSVPPSSHQRGKRANEGAAPGAPAAKAHH
jgi:glutamate--cysteine ligase catalytic subunit